MSNSVRGRRPLGLSLVWIWALAALAVPRAVAHDLDLVGPTVNSVLVFAPAVVWLAVVLPKRVPRPFLTLLMIGVCHGILLAATHQVLWTQAHDAAPPRLGGNLEGTFSPGVEAVVMRLFAVFSSLLTGAGVGAVAGAVGWLLARMVPAFRPRL
ncbi:hypothetical protein [Actinophytocola glycyrrhizae]|uniref:Uncharacterized protein n=1 Tax=Actinophytocola glycyrrhizae TaxID=2044873 RepID=A0ABV9S4D8_9PSEU